MIEGLWGEGPDETASESGEPPSKRPRTGVPGQFEDGEFPDFVEPETATTYLVIVDEDLHTAGIPAIYLPSFEKRPPLKDGKYFCRICGENRGGNRYSALTHVRRHLKVYLGCPHCSEFGVQSSDAWEKHMKGHPDKPHRVSAEIVATPASDVEAAKVEAIISEAQ